MIDLIIPGIFGVALLQLAWLPQNDGQGFHDDPRDPGRATSWGMTFTTYAGWEAMHGRTVSLEAFKALPREAFIPVYRTAFFQAVRGDELPPGVAISVFDAACGSAPHHAIEFLQYAVGASQDGVFGDKTMAAVRAADPVAIIKKIEADREIFYAGLPNFRIYGNGWDRRARQGMALSIQQQALVHA